jgi:CheY-like chemotaxis protein/PAS domain-containing protein
MPHPDILASLNQPIFELDFDGKVIFATPALAQWTGREFSPASAYNFAEVLSSKDRMRFNQALKRLLSGEASRASVALQLKSKSAAEQGSVELTLTALPVAVPVDLPAFGNVEATDIQLSGKPKEAVRVAAFMRDTRTEKAAEAAANLQTTHLLDLVENITDGCVVETADGSVEMVNSAFCEMFAIDVAPQSWVATSCASLFELASMVVERNAGPVYSSQIVNAPLVTTLSIGGEKISHTVFAAVPDAGLAVGSAGRLHLFKHAETLADINVDTVAGKETNKETNKNVGNNASSGLASRSRVQLQFIERIRADLATTIDAAFSAIHHARQTELSDRALEHFRRVEASAHVAVSAIAGLLDLADTDTHTIALETASFHLRESIASVLNIVVPRAEEHGIDVTLRVEQDVPENLTGDGARLMMLLRHLIEMGFHNHDVTDDGVQNRTQDSKVNDAKIALTIQPEYTDNGAIYLSFTVKHHSSKISAGADSPIDKSAGKFADDMASGVVNASSMQLALARQIARALAAHGENLADPTKTVKPNPANRSNAKNDIEIQQWQDHRVSKPAGKKPDVPIQITSYKFTAPFSFAAKVPVTHRPTFVTLTGLQVLLVSPDKDERQRLAELARNWRMLPREADGAAMALQLLNRMAEEEIAIPLVITSNQLPLQDGFLLAFRIKHHPKLKDTRVIMLAKNGRPGDAIQCRENGISAYLRDPISPDQLVDAVGAVMGTKEDAEATQTLITRHSLREAKTGTVLLIDGHHDQAAMAANFLKRRDFRVVIVESAEAAAASLAQDMFDVIVVDAQAAGFAASPSIAVQLRLNLPNGAGIPILLALTDYAKVDASEYQGVITKPYEKDALLEKVAAAIKATSSVVVKNPTTKLRRSGD